MNVDLMDPFADKYPNEISSILEEEANVARFNLAVGRSDGYVAVWDVETKAVAWAARAHSVAVESVWSVGSGDRARQRRA
jgi:hypothetical protein